MVGGWIILSMLLSLFPDPVQVAGEPKPARHMRKRPRAGILRVRALRSRPPDRRRRPDPNTAKPLTNQPGSCAFQRKFLHDLSRECTGGLHALPAPAPSCMHPSLCLCLNKEHCFINFLFVISPTHDVTMRHAHCCRFVPTIYLYS